MTIRDKILELSSLPSGNTVRDHLLSMSPEGFSDCTESIALAIANYKSEAEVREEIVPSPRLIVVQDGRVSNSATGTIGGEIDGEVSTSDISGNVESRGIGGKVGSGTTSGKIGSGSISGRVSR